MERHSGILLHIATLPCRYGIGQLGKSAYDFADFLADSAQSYWQVLPLVPTGYGDSPYQSCCASAGNEYFIDLDLLAKEGLLTDEELASCVTEADSRINYENLYYTRYEILRKAFSRYDKTDAEFVRYVKRGEFADYALFRTIKDSFGGAPWNEWDVEFRLRDAETLKRFSEAHADDILFWQWAQFVFHKQWSALKEYAARKGIKMIGDMPIYLAYDSVECWTHPEMVKLDEDLRPTAVAGCPPDAFCDTGQLWGNPVYDWNYMERDGFKWWIARLKKCFELYDVVRIDHFRGFDRYYEIPFGEKTAVNGVWQPAAGRAMFKAAENELGEMQVIAEDLGILDDSARDMFAALGYPGMKILQFAFDSGDDNDYLPHNYKDGNCIVYTGTHDNDTLLGFIRKLGGRKEYFACALARELERMGLPQCGASDEEMCDSVIELCYASAADCAIIPMQDWMKTGEEGRINMPSVLSTSNWSYRISPDYAELGLQKRIKELTVRYGR